METPECRNESTERLSLGDLAQTWRRRWRTILFCSFGMMVAGLVWFWVTTPQYVAEMTIAPPLNDLGRQDGLGGSALSSLGLDNFMGPSSQPFMRYQQLVTSYAVAARLQSQHHVLQIIFASRWKPDSRTWSPPGGLRGLFSSEPPNIDDLVDFLEKRVTIQQAATNSPVYILTLYWRDPAEARAILAWIHLATNKVIRQTQLARTNAILKYLTGKLAQVSNTDEHSALIRLLITHEQNLTLLNSTPEFAAVALDPPHAPVKPSYPRLSLTLIFSAFIGIFLGLLLASFGAGSPGIRSRGIRETVQGEDDLD
jgi:hypothetical protein